MIGRWVIGLMLFGAIFTTALRAADRPVFTADQQADLQRIWDYFGRLKTLTAFFEQFSSDGRQASGQLYLHRPGRLRIEYQPPTPMLIIADGRHLVYYDTELNSVTGLPLDETPAAIILNDNFNSSKSDWVATALDKNPGSLRLTLSHRDHREYGEVTLVFADQPLALKKWHIRDVEGIETTISLNTIRQDVDLEDQLFIIEDPRSLHNPFIR